MTLTDQGAPLIGSSRRFAIACAVLLFAVAIVPVWSVNIPPLLDYPNHLTRQYILANLQHSEDLRRFYTSEWFATPYLAMDVFVQAIAPLVPIEAAGRLFLSSALLLLGFGPIALSLALNRRVTVFSLLGMMFAYSHLLSLGFMPYLFSLGVAICLTSLWIWQREGHPLVRFLLMPALTVALFFSHLIGFVVYALLASLYEFGRHVETVRHRLPRSPFRLDPQQRFNLASLGLQFAVPLVIFYLLGPSSETADAASETTHGGIQRKIELLLGVFEYLIPPYFWSLDRALAVAIPIALVVLIATRRVSIARDMRWPLIGLLVLFFAMPVEWFGGWGGDHRLFPAIGSVLAGSLVPRSTDLRMHVAKASIAVLAALILVRVTFVTIEWRKADQEYSEFFEAFELLRPASRLYYAVAFEGPRLIGRRPKIFIPCLAVTKKQVYVPYLFTGSAIRGLPLRYRPEFETIQLASPGPYLPFGQSPNWPAIQEAYDFVLLVDGHHLEAPVPRQFKMLYRGRSVVLYEVTRL